jgi:MFS family permease
LVSSVAYALGMAIGGIAVDRIGIYNTILIDAILFSIAIYLFQGIKFHIRKKTTQNIYILIREGFLYLKKHKLLLHLIFLHSAVAFTSFDALINFLTDMRYKYIIAIPLAIGWLNGVRALGLMIGPLVIGKIVKTKNLHLFFIGQGIIILLWSPTEHNFYLSLCMMFLVGFFYYYSLV